MRGGGLFSRKSLQWTPDNSNLQGKSKKVRLIGSLKQITGSKGISKSMGPEGMQLSNKVNGSGH